MRENQIRNVHIRSLVIDVRIISICRFEKAPQPCEADYMRTLMYTRDIFLAILNKNIKHVILARGPIEHDRQTHTTKAARTHRLDGRLWCTRRWRYCRCQRKRSDGKSFHTHIVRIIVAVLRRRPLVRELLYTDMCFPPGATVVGVAAAHRAK